MLQSDGLNTATNLIECGNARRMRIFCSYAYVETILEFFVAELSVHIEHAFNYSG
jgi:hypothetical protein